MNNQRFCRCEIQDFSSIDDDQLQMKIRQGISISIQSSGPRHHKRGMSASIVIIRC